MIQWNVTAAYQNIKKIAIHLDVIALTDQTGGIVATYKYDSWGNPMDSKNHTVIALENPYRYAGYQYDEETGLYYLMAGGIVVV
ncbi:hypothetical protein [Peribacillus loiseleuriae]|uniref:hypothetical protein n=1 Tax=Peribacillus loiseleuriae TaxID=1679170 RepID=UPI003D0039B8